MRYALERDFPLHDYSHYFRRNASWKNWSGRSDSLRAVASPPSRSFALRSARCVAARRFPPNRLERPGTPPYSLLSPTFHSTRPAGGCIERALCDVFLWCHVIMNGAVNGESSISRGEVTPEGGELGGGTPSNPARLLRLGLRLRGRGVCLMRGRMATFKVRRRLHLKPLWNRLFRDGKEILTSNKTAFNHRFRKS